MIQIGGTWYQLILSSQADGRIRFRRIEGPVQDDEIEGI